MIAKVNTENDLGKVEPLSSDASKAEIQKGVRPNLIDTQQQQKQESVPKLSIPEGPDLSKLRGVRPNLIDTQKKQQQEPVPKLSIPEGPDLSKLRGVRPNLIDTQKKQQAESVPKLSIPEGPDLSKLRGVRPNLIDTQKKQQQEPVPKLSIPEGSDLSNILGVRPNLIDTQPKPQTSRLAGLANQVAKDMSKLSGGTPSQDQAQFQNLEKRFTEIDKATQQEIKKTDAPKVVKFIDDANAFREKPTVPKDKKAKATGWLNTIKDRIHMHNAKNRPNTSVLTDTKLKMAEAKQKTMAPAEKPKQAISRITTKLKSLKSR